MIDDILKRVRERYGLIATSTEPRPGCGCSCGCGPEDPVASASLAVGYSAEELASIPDQADLGVGCGNPLSLAEVRKGDTVLDLGAGAGIDCFLASERVGENGRVIGVDMTPEMVERARRNAHDGGYANVEFREGHIESLPVDDASVDLVISNCVINLSPQKSRVFREAFRVLRPGGRIAVSDIVLTGPLPEPIRYSVAAYVGCIAGASLREDYLAAMRTAGFEDIEVVAESRLQVETFLDNPDMREMIEGTGLDPTQVRDAAQSVVSAKVRAVKPA